MCAGMVMEGRVDHGRMPPPPLASRDGGPGPALLCQAKARSDLVIGAAELEMVSGPQRLPCRVVSVEKLTGDVALLRVRVPPNERLRFLAGQYVEFEYAGLRRNYSIANRMDEIGSLTLEFHVKHRPHGIFTDHVFSAMKPRDLLTINAPLGTFFLRDAERPIILCATGTGFAPVKAILETAFAAGVHERRAVHFYWGGRVLGELYMLDLIHEWVSRYRGFIFHPVLSGGVTVGATARAGYVHHAVLADFADLSSYQVYACGAPEMIGAARAAFTTQRGLPAGQFYADEFLPAASAAALIPS